MANGTTKRIDQIREGDYVLATDPETGETGPREVVATLPHTDQLLTLRTSSGDVVTTEDHKYWNQTDHAWQESQDLDEGDRLLSAEGDEVIVEGLDWTTVHTAPAYDLTIDGLHTFYVAAGDEAVLVHNCGNADILRKNMEARGLYGAGDLQPHHIVPHGSYANRAAADFLSRAQAKLKQLGVDINDADNGVYLKRGCHQSVGHTNDMFRRLDGALSGASTADQARGILRGFGQELHNLCI